MRLCGKEQPASVLSRKIGFKRRNRSCITGDFTVGPSGKTIQLTLVPLWREDKRAIPGHAGHSRPEIGRFVPVDNHRSLGRGTFALRGQHPASPPGTAMRPRRSGPVDQPGGQAA
jgi:hypothetical protein